MSQLIWLVFCTVFVVLVPGQYVTEQMMVYFITHRSNDEIRSQHEYPYVSEQHYSP